MTLQTRDTTPEISAILASWKHDLVRSGKPRIRTQAYIGCLREFEASCRAGLEHATAAHVAAFIDDPRATLNTRRRRTIALRTFFKWLRKPTATARGTLRHD